MNIYIKFWNTKEEVVSSILDFIENEKRLPITTVGNSEIIYEDNNTQYKHQDTVYDCLEFIEEQLPGSDLDRIVEKLRYGIVMG